MFDIDHFKLVNDSYGHGVGDRVLKEVSALPVFRQEDALIRYGGEEFLVILFHTTREGAHTFGERLRAEVAAKPFNRQAAPLHVTLSAGIATHPDDRSIKDPETFLALTDRRLYAAKRAGRNRVVSRD
jgi:diguanylate cyclase (GGDEF)-like protein